jgi:flap endonuclease-1
MGVDLTDLASKQQVELEHLTGRKIAVDAYNTLYQFLSIIRQPDGTPLMTSNGVVTSHLTGLLYRTSRLMEKGIKPCFVFDGTPPEQKQATLEARKKTKTEAKKKWDQALKQGKQKEALKYAKRTSKLTDKMVDQSKELLDALGIPFVQAPGEGEAQAAFMVSQGSVWAVGSQDFDSLLFGAPVLVKNIALTGKRKIPNRDAYVTIKPEVIRLEQTLSQLGLSREQLVEIGLLVGTDYNNGVKGIGPKTALDLIKQGKTAQQVFQEHGVQEDVQQLKHLFLKPKTTQDFDLSWREPDEQKVLSLMVDKYEFSKDRVENAVKKIATQNKTPGSQSRLDQFK